MPLREYECHSCGIRKLFFPEERHRIVLFCAEGCCGTKFHHVMMELPVRPAVVHSTEQFMLERGYLDSLGSIYELDRILNLEARADKELKAIEQARKEM